MRFVAGDAGFLPLPFDVFVDIVSICSNVQMLGLRPPKR